jgi:mannose-6-phosphate isomerase-like protein (cupin superfamily)
MQELHAPGSEAQEAVYDELLRVPDLSVGCYRLPAGATDVQSPHTEDEVYVVTAGRATLWSTSGSVAVGPGSVVFVPAGEDHRFVDITVPLTVLVFFGPAEHTRRDT